MIDLDKMQLNIFLCSSHGDRVSMIRGDVVELIARLREAEKDAARYRWLRDKAYRIHIMDICTLHSAEWDAMVDQAMKERGDD